MDTGRPCGPSAGYLQGYGNDFSEMAQVATQSADTCRMGNKAHMVTLPDVVVSPTVQTAGGFPRVAET